VLQRNEPGEQLLKRTRRLPVVQYSMPWLAATGDQLHAKWSLATKHAILTRASSTAAAQPWMLLQGPAFGGRALEKLVCEVTLVL